MAQHPHDLRYSGIRQGIRRGYRYGVSYEGAATVASLYAGVVRSQSFGGPKAPTDPVAMVILRLARKAIMSRPEVSAASKADRLATINRLAVEYVKEHDAQLRPRAQKIVALENDQAEPAPVQKHEPMFTKKKKAA